MSDQKVCPTCGTEYPLSERFCPRDGTALRATNAQGDLLGSIIAERYHILKKLGEGGMGTVYLAEHVKMGRKAALKVMNPGMNQDADAIARFNREAANASRLSHPNICGIYDFGETPDGLIYLAMEFIEGVSLSDLIEKSGALTPARAAAIIHQSADALQVAHDVGIVHRDLKPDNIMITKARDGSDSTKVVDFGIAKASSSDAQKVTKTGLVVGTPEYMSPEQLSGDKLDGRSDIYSLGLVAFNCLTGKLPFPSETAQEAMIMRLTDQPKTLAEMMPDRAWPEQLQAVLDKALTRDANERYASAAEFGRDMARAVENMPSAVVAEGATMVIGSDAAVAAAAAKTAAAVAVPKTRQASAAERGGAVSPAAAQATVPAKKGGMSTMMIAAAAVVIIGGGGWYAVTQMGNGAGAVDPDSSAQGLATQTSPQNTQSTQTPPAGGVRDPAPVGRRGGDTKLLSTPTNAAANPPVDPGRSGGGGTVGGERTGAPDPAAEIARWERMLGDPSATEETASQGVVAMEKLIDATSGPARASAYYVQSMGYAVLGDEKACSVAKLALSTGLAGAQRRAAQTFVDKACP